MHIGLMFDVHQRSLNIVGLLLDLFKQGLRWFDALPF
jgi:hypothetical protein